MLVADDKVAFLQSLAWDAEDRSVSIAALIKAAIRAQIKNNPNGQTVIATAGNGRSVTFTLPDFLKTLTQDEVRRMWVQLKAIYDTAIVTLGISVPALTDRSHDAAILAAMLADDRMKSVTSFGNDYTLLRWPQIR